MKELNYEDQKDDNIGQLKEKLYNLIIRGKDLESDAISNVYSRIKEKDPEFKLYYDDDPQLLDHLNYMISNKGLINIYRICGTVMYDSKDNSEFVIPLDSRNTDMLQILMLRFFKTHQLVL